MCVCVCVWLCTCVFFWLCACVFVFGYVRLPLCVCMCVWLCVCLALFDDVFVLCLAVYVWLCVRGFVFVCMAVCVLVYVCALVFDIVCVCVCVYLWCDCVWLCKREVTVCVPGGCRYCGAAERYFSELASNWRHALRDAARNGAGSSSQAAGMLLLPNSYLEERQGYKAQMTNCFGS
jgi:hypothetical protein